MIKKKEAELFFRQFLDRIQETGLADLLLFEAGALLANIQTENKPSDNNSTLKHGKHDSEEVYSQLCDLMQHRTLYTNPRITRKQVAKLLNTNETYLYNILYVQRGVTFKTYLRELRIAHACRMLADVVKNPHSIDKIGKMSGFSSRAHLLPAVQRSGGSNAG